MKPNRYRFSGKEDETGPGEGLVDFGHRIYDPETARWTTRDPLADKYPGHSPYSFCLDDPINHVDPQGDTVAVIYSNGFFGHLAIKNLRVKTIERITDSTYYFYCRRDGKKWHVLSAVAPLDSSGTYRPGRNYPIFSKPACNTTQLIPVHHSEIMLSLRPVKKEDFPDHVMDELYRRHPNLRDTPLYISRELNGDCNNLRCWRTFVEQFDCFRDSVLMYAPGVILY